MPSPDPVARRIGDRPLVLGDRDAAERADDGDDPDDAYGAVLSLTREPVAATTHHHPLVDGPTNAQAAVREAIETAVELYDPDGMPLLVHCAAGISRSATVVASVVAATEERPFEAALDVVAEARPRADPSLSLRRHAQLYLSRVDGHPQSFDDAALDHDGDASDAVTCAGCLDPVDVADAVSFTRYDQPIHPDRECHRLVYR